MNRAGRVIALLWITFACCTGSYADDGDGQECSIVWEIVQIQTYDLVLRWSGDDSAQVSTVQLKFNAVSVNTTTCPATLGETNAGFSDQQLELNLLCPNTQYTLNIIFHCTENSTTIWTPPGSPVNVTIPDDDVTNTSFAVSWFAPPGSADILYTVNVNGTLFVKETVNTNIWYTDLRPFTNYSVEVAAKNKDFPGRPSPTVEVQTKAGTPGPPRLLSVSSTASSLSLAWEDPEPSGVPIESFEVQWRTATGDFGSHTTAEKSFTIESLTPYTNYTVRVRAKTYLGEGEWTDEIDHSTEIGIPHQPQNFEEVSRTNTSIYLEWEEPKPPTGPILCYGVWWSGGAEERDFNVTETFFNVTGLKPYTKYKLKTSAFTEAGGGQWTEVIEVQTGVGVPSAPTGLEVRSSTDTSLLLAWKDPEPFTGPIEDFEVEWTNSGDPQTDRTKVNSYNVTGLVSFTPYKLRVRARTSAGEGPWSEYIVNRTAVGVPNPPRHFLMKLRTNTSLYFEWAEPEPHTGPILSYSVLCTGSSESESNTSNTFLNVTGLTPFTDYSVKARAHTEAGPSQWTKTLVFKTDIGVPHSPRTLNHTLVTNTSVTLIWLSPVPSTGPISTYVVKWNSSRDTGSKDMVSNRTEHTISGLLPYLDYVFQVQAVTTAGQGEWSHPITLRTDIGVPHAPTTLNHTSITNTSVVLSWSEPSPSTGPISTYVAQWRSPRGAGLVITNSNRTTQEISGLVPYVNYTFQMMAETRVGRGAASDGISVETCIGVPHAPTTLTQTLFTNTSVALTWREPVPSTGPVLTYILLWSSSRGTSGQKDTGSSITSHVISELLPCVKYTFQVLAVTSAGRGAGSNSITVETKVGVPHEPTALRRGTVTNTSVSLIWKEPSPSTGSISTYVVKWSSPRGDGQRDDTRSNASSYVVNGLLPFVQYTFRVLAVTSAGSGKNSDSIVVQTEVGVPHAPQALTNTSAKNTSIALAWQEPDPSTGPITTYIVRWSSDKGADGERDTRSSELRYEFSGLHPFRDYTFQVQAMTVAGKGEWSDDKTVRTDIGIPTVPLNLMQERLTDVSVTIRWDQPQFPNGPDLGYEIQLTLASSDANGTDKQSSRVHSNQRSVQHMISGLLPYTHYSVRVAAVTGLGCGQWTDILLFQTLVGAPKPAVLKSVAAQGRRAVLVQWSTVGPYPGPVDYSLQAWMGPGRCSSGTSSYIHAKERKGDMGPEAWKLGIQRNTVTDLSPYGIYHFLIVLRTSATDGIESEQSEDVRMAPEAAAEPTDVTSNCHFSSTKARVSWMPPKQPNGIIDSYDIEYSMDSKWRTVNVPVKDPCAGRSHVLTGLRPERPYKIKVYAWVKNVTSAGKSALSKGTCILPAGIPSVSNTSRLLAKGTGSDHVILEWTQDTFSDFMGSIVYYAVLVGRRDALGNATSGTSIDKGPPWSNFSSGFSDFYQATPPFWNPFNQEPDPLLCVSSLEAGPDGNHTLLRCLVGAQDVCPDNETYCNGPLLPDTQYEMKIRAFTRGGYTETDLIYTQTGPKPRGSAVGAVVTVIVVLLLVASLVAGGYVMKKKGYLPTLMNTFQKRIRSRRKESAPKPCVESSMEHLERCTSPRPIKSRHFADHVRTMMSDSHLKFSLEFEMLKNESPHPPCNVAEMDENRFKNRWMNIFPFDHSRVKLLPLSDEPGSDFINANYIPGYSSRREYIATQGPLPHTVDDFWRMLWEQSVSMVVMLTQCVERGKKKCEQYWPESGEARYYGDMRVGTVSESMLSCYVIRIFHVQLGSHERRIKQMHFTHWPDFGCPESPEDLVNFVRAVRDHLPRHEPGPILVHCSAGVGRTGTFIAVDRLAQQLSYRHIPLNDLVDIYGSVLDLRNHRTNMVQTEDQYIYIHLCVRELIWERDTPTEKESEDLVYSNIGVQRDTGV